MDIQGSAKMSAYSSCPYGLEEPCAECEAIEIEPTEDGWRQYKEGERGYCEHYDTCLHGWKTIDGKIVCIKCLTELVPNWSF